MFIPFAVHHGRLDLTNWFQIVQVGNHFLGSGLAIVQSSHLSLNDAFSIFFCRAGQLHKLFLRLAAPNCICKYGMAILSLPFVPSHGKQILYILAISSWCCSRWGMSPLFGMSPLLGRWGALGFCFWSEFFAEFHLTLHFCSMLQDMTQHVWACTTTFLAKRS